MPIAEIQKSVLDAFESFRGEEPTFDDTAILSLRFR
jgi:serine phosphatase RsbU (regulator of sigma subunit)